MKEKYKNLTTNTILFAISSFGTKILSFLLVPLYTNVLTTGEYGVADVLSTTTTLLVVVFTINIADGILIFALDKKFNSKNVLAFGIKVVLLGWVFLALLCSLMVLFDAMRWSKLYYVFVVLYFGSSALYQVMSNYLRAVDKVKEVAVAGILSSVVFILGNVIFLLVVDMGLKGYLISTILGPLTGMVYCFVVAEVPVVYLITNTCNRLEKKQIVIYCIPLIFNSIALWINSCLDRYFITAICGVEQTGIYSVANKIPIILSTFYTVFSQAWTLSAVKEFDKNDTDGFFSNTYSVYNASMCIVCSALILFNIPMAKVLYAKEFFVAWNYSSVLLIAILFNSLTAFVGSIFSAIKKSNILAITTLASAIVNTILNVVLIPAFEVMGAAIATAVALFVMWIIRIALVRKNINLKIEWLSNVVVYFLICLQVMFEHTENHGYLMQSIIFLSVVFLNRKYLLKIIRLMIYFVERKVGKGIRGK